MYDMPMNEEGAAHRLQMAEYDIRRVLIQWPGFPADIARALGEAAALCHRAADDLRAGGWPGEAAQGDMIAAMMGRLE